MRQLVDRSSISSTFGQRLRHLRRARGLTLSDLGERVGQAPSPALAAGERQARAEAVAARRRSPPRCRCRSRNCSLPSAQPAGAAGDRAGGGAARPALPRSAFRPEGRQAGAERGARAHPGAVRASCKRRARSPPRRPRRRGWPTRSCDAACASRATTSPRSNASPPRPGLGRLPRRRAVAGASSIALVSPTSASPCGTSRTCRGRSARSPTCATGGSTSSASSSACTRRGRSCCRRSGTSPLGHAQPRDFADFLRQRVEANYFAAAVLVPGTVGGVPYLQEAKAGPGAGGGGPAGRLRGVVRDGRAPLHQPGHALPRPAAATSSGTTRAESSTRRTRTTGWSSPPTSRGRSRGSGCAASGRGGRSSLRRTGSRLLPVHGHADRHATGASRTSTRAASGDFAITLGRAVQGVTLVPRPRDHEPCEVALPDRHCCRARRPSSAGAGRATPGRRPAAHSHVLAALPPGSFPGVDEADVYTFLDRHADV